MTRQEAEKLIGSRVWAWTAANGHYVGILEEVLPRRPWRARVRITGVLAPAVPWERGRTTQRKGFRPGYLIEAGGANVKPSDKQGTSYAEALLASLDTFRAMRQTADPKDFWWIDRSIAELEARVREEAVAAAQDMEKQNILRSGLASDRSTL